MLNGTKKLPPGDSKRRRTRRGGKKSSLLFAGVIRGTHQTRIRSNPFRPNKFNFPLLFKPSLSSSTFRRSEQLSLFAVLWERERYESVYYHLLVAECQALLRIPFSRQYFHISSVRWPCLFSPLPILKPRSSAPHRTLTLFFPLSPLFSKRGPLSDSLRWVTLLSRTHPLQMLRFLREADPVFSSWNEFGYRFEIGDPFLR